MTNTLWMEKPLCKICEPPRRHWSSEPHQFRSEVIEHEVDPTPVRSTAVKVDAATEAVVVSKGEQGVSIPRPRQASGAGEVGDEAASGEKEVAYKYRDPEKWRSYMKEYMRAYRARQRL